MTPAPLQLRDYWVDYICVRTNHSYDSHRAPDLDFDTLELDADVQQRQADEPEKNGTMWLVHLNVKQAVPEGKNIPYDFVLEMSGRVAAHPSLSGEQLERAVQVNGPSMLFGAAREILRAATGRGPFAPVIIPSTNFLQRLPKAESQPPSLGSSVDTPDAGGKPIKKTLRKPSSRKE